MGDPVLMTVVGVGAALTKMFLRACDVASAADLIGDSQELLGTLLRVSRRSDGSKDQIERSVSKALATRIQEIHKHRCGQDLDRQLLSGVCTEVEILLDEIANDGELILSAALKSDNLPAVFHSRAAQRRLNIEEAAEPYFDELVEAVTTQYAALAPWSQRFQIEALRSILAGIDELQDYSRRSLQAHEMTHEMLDTVLSNLAEVTRHEDKPRRILFGSRPDVTTGSRFVARVEQDQLNELITDTTKQRTVLVGMRGCGKTQLAAALAKQCEDANWSLVAWVNASSLESIKSGFVELAQELKIDTSNQPTQGQIIRRCFDYLRSADPTDRLIIFDNVENIEDLRGLMPSGDGLRVVATTTNNTGWEHQDWTTIKVGLFDHSESIKYLLTVTKSDEHDAADALAVRLGDLPLAIAQAAATTSNKKLSLTRYLKRLESHRKEHAIRPVPGDDYTDDVATALWMAVEDAIDGLEGGTKEAARHQLGALALLAESGVPTRWLDPTIEQLYDDDSPGTHRDSDEDAHDALTELIHRSIVQQSADGSTTMLHRLQAQVLRESWTNDEQDEAHAAATDLLGSVNIRKYPSNDTKARRQEALDLVEQLRSIGSQEHSQILFEYPQTTVSLYRAFSHASELGLDYEALTLDVAVDSLDGLLGPDHPASLTSRNNLAYAYHAVGRLSDAITQYEQVLTDSIRVLGQDHPDTLASRNDLAGAYESAGRLTEAIALYEQVQEDYTQILGDNHPSTLTSRNNLAGAYESAGRLTEAITQYELVLTDRIRVLGEDHPDTLTSRNNLAGAYESAGRLTEAIALYEHVQEVCTRILGKDHPRTLTSLNNLACAYREGGRLIEAIALYEQALTDRIRVLGKDHPRTLTSLNNLAHAYHTAGHLIEANALYEQLLADSIRVLGEDHPDTLISRNNLAGTKQVAGHLTEAIGQFEQLLADCLRVLDTDHPLTAVVRKNLEEAERELAQQKGESSTEED